MSITTRLREMAEQLGFPLFGISPVGTPPHLATFNQWVRAGSHAGMEYLATEPALLKRSDPALLLPGAQSIITVGIPYASPLEYPESLPPLHGRTAAYAWGEDYHHVIPPRLDQLSKEISQLNQREIFTRSYTDTGAILERDFGQLSGLGWVGKNTCLISPRHGSFFFLAEILTTSRLDPTPPFIADRCGTCTRCLITCPTGCIQPDRTLDATRCISYLTIENKGAIPRHLRPLIGNWIFGCDICQMVCPWNQRSKTSVGTVFLPQSSPFTNLLEKLYLSDSGFNHKFRSSPIKRVKRAGYLRNICVALGNARDCDAIPALAHVMKCEPHPLIRLHAAWALGQFDQPEAQDSLLTALKHERDATVIIEVKLALESRRSNFLKKLTSFR